MKKLILLLITLSFSLVATADKSGTCGDNLTWTYETATKKLTISGNGDMKDYSPLTPSPWYSYYDSNSVTNVVIEEGVTSIGNYAFYECSNLQSISMPNSLISIRQRAFYKCYGLTLINIPNGVTSISNGAFEETGLTSVTIPNSINVINYDVFAGCTSLTNVTIPNSVVVIADRAFSRCALNSVVIPNSVTSIGNSAFEYCKMNTVIIPNSVKSIGNSAFQACTEMHSITIGDSVEKIGEKAFLYCNNLARVYCYPEIAPSSTNPAFDYSAIIFVSETAYSSYINAPGWVNRTIRTKEVDPIEDGGIWYYLGVITPFAEVTNNPNIIYEKGIYEIPEKIVYDDKEYIVKYIGSEAFKGCENLVKITFPNKLTSIGYSAFDGCI